MHGKHLGNPEARFKLKDYTGPASFLKKGNTIEMKIEHFYSKKKKGITFIFTQL
jgi:hypothetical protein